MRQHLAWTSILAERRELNLHAYSEAQMKTKTEESDSTVDHRIRETYTWLLVPGQQERAAGCRCDVGLPLSRGTRQIESLNRSLAIYDMVFGRPRQDDLLARTRSV